MFAGLAFIQRDLLAAFAQANQIETKIRFIALLHEIQVYKWPSDPMGNETTDESVQNTTPNHVAGNSDFVAGERKCQRSGNSPQHADKGDKCDRRVQQADHEPKGIAGVFIQVFRNALIGIVGLVTRKLHAVVSFLLQPASEKILVEPIAPAHLQHLRDIGFVNRNQYPYRGDGAEDPNLFPKCLGVFLFQRIVERLIPLIQSIQKINATKIQYENQNQ